MGKCSALEEVWRAGLVSAVALGGWLAGWLTDFDGWLERAGLHSGVGMRVRRGWGCEGDRLQRGGERRARCKLKLLAELRSNLR